MGRGIRGLSAGTTLWRESPPSPALHLSGGPASAEPLARAAARQTSPRGPPPAPSSASSRRGHRDRATQPGSLPSTARCAARTPIPGAGPPAAGSGQTMRPTSSPPARWLCMLASALACTLGPAVSARRAARSPGRRGWSGGGGSPAVCAHVCGSGMRGTEHRVSPPSSASSRI